MAIHVTCECGKQLHAPDEFAGRQTRCPACQRPLTLPAAGAAIMPASAPLSPAPPSPAAFAAQPVAPGVPGLPPGYLATPATSKQALISLILGCVAFCLPLLLSVPAIVLGFLGLSAIKKSGGQLGGRTMAIVGLVLGFVTLPLFVVYVLFGYGVVRGMAKAEDAVNRISSTNNMKQMAIALHTHADANNLTFPTERDGSSKLSWRVQILPYLEQEALYQRFRHNEAWDSPTNKALLSEMPKIYLDPRFQKPEDRKTGLTYYRAFVCEDSVLGSPVPLSLNIVTNANGTSNTIVAVEAGDPVPWTKPEDPSFNGDSPFGGPEHTTFLIMYMDGHVILAPAKTDRNVIRTCINWKNTTMVIPP
jgi:hypothetical protein